MPRDTGFRPQNSEDAGTFTSGAVKIESSVRAMKTYTITESELMNITLANGAAAVCFSLMSALIVYGLDITKDIAMAGATPSPAENLLMNTIRPFCFIVATVCALCGIGLLYWRHEMIRLIRGESVNKPKEAASRDTLSRIGTARKTPL